MRALCGFLNRCSRLCRDTGFYLHEFHLGGRAGLLTAAARLRLLGWGRDGFCLGASGSGALSFHLVQVGIAHQILQNFFRFCGYACRKLCGRFCWHAYGQGRWCGRGGFDLRCLGFLSRRRHGDRKRSSSSNGGSFEGFGS